MCWTSWLCVIAGKHVAEAYRNHIYQGESSIGPRPGTDAECRRYDDDDPSFSASLDQTVYPWRRRVRSLGDVSVLYGTAFSQRAIFQHQYPQDCTKAKFLTLRHFFATGIGAAMHFLARALGYAMQEGRILTVAGHDTGWNWVDISVCKAKHSWECYLLPFTNCSSSKPKADIMTINSLDLYRFRISSNISRHDFVPEGLRQMLVKCSRVKPRLRFYWWHAQAVTFLMRFNENMQLAIRHGRTYLRTRFPAKWRAYPGMRHISRVPSGTVAMHVRHGDKWMESPLLPFEAYRAEAEKLAACKPSRVLDARWADGDREFEYACKTYAGRSMLVSTEDPEVIHEALRLPWAQEPWQVIFQGGVNRSNEDVGQKMGQAEFVLEALMNLESALQADAWVCNLLSNWCQLIDELRMTVGGKAAAPFVQILPPNMSRAVCPRFDPRCYVISVDPQRSSRN
eukprot:TRINITY_DN25606_c0_g1_i1.p1 TRINITY_DN25606_c0_g1~~TRINITY_DN25606_c0_g1_i1.p1  ORF type:complete len:454 (-),score=50.22 TRINITY_DN25606_c0_g1_i1:430-1791(-)